MNQGSWTITLASVRGIPIRIHVTFIVFLAAIVLPGATSAAAALYELMFLIGIFTCIALHELGHALAASYFGIKTRDIILYPFGGIASITKMPAPAGELIIALAGPLVNIIIASILFLTMDVSQMFVGLSIVSRLFFANIFLAVFNLIPAIPMDGGRVLRALLELGHISRATLIATRVSQLISLLLAFVALYWGRMDLLLVATVVFVGALQEQVQSQARRAVIGCTVADAMIDASRLQCFPHGATLADALVIALRSLQDYFPVLYAGEVRGVVSKDQLIQFAASNEENAYLQEITDKEFPTVRPNQDLSTLLEPLQVHQEEPYFIVQSEDGRFLGMLLREKIIEFLLVDELKRRMASGRHLDESAPL